jgi:hypothetical protein
LRRRATYGSAGRLVELLDEGGGCSGEEAEQLTVARTAELGGVAGGRGQGADWGQGQGRRVDGGEATVGQLGVGVAAADVDALAVAAGAVGDEAHAEQVHGVLASSVAAGLAGSVLDRDLKDLAARVEDPGHAVAVDRHAKGRPAHAELDRRAGRAGQRADQRERIFGGADLARVEAAEVLLLVDDVDEVDAVGGAGAAAATALALGTGGACRDGVAKAAVVIALDHGVAVAGVALLGTAVDAANLGLAQPRAALGGLEGAVDAGLVASAGAAGLTRRAAGGHRGVGRVGAVVAAVAGCARAARGQRSVDGDQADPGCRTTHEPPAVLVHRWRSGTALTFHDMALVA